MSRDLAVAKVQERTSMPAIKSPKKLIEVALPLDKINVAAAREAYARVDSEAVHA